MNDRFVKEFFYKSTEARKGGSSIRFAFKRVKPYIFGVVVDKNNIIFVIVMRKNWSSPNIRKNEFKRGIRSESRFRKWEFVIFLMLHELQGITDDIGKEN